LANSSSQKPLLFVDVDGVISLFGYVARLEQLPGPLHWIDGVQHCIPPAMGPRLVRLASAYELVWATGWEEKANEYLPHILGLPFRDLPTLTFDGRAVFGTAHWKLDAIERYAADRPAAWVDDSLDEECVHWARTRGSRAPTLLVETDPATGLTDDRVDELMQWAAAL
jgi:HAD domain in Swiss Army Knife RNA repair proteins